MLPWNNGDRMAFECLRCCAESSLFSATNWQTLIGHCWQKNKALVASRGISSGIICKDHCCTWERRWWELSAIMGHGGLALLDVGEDLTSAFNVPLSLRECKMQMASPLRYGPTDGAELMLMLMFLPHGIPIIRKWVAGSSMAVPSTRLNSSSACCLSLWMEMHAPRPPSYTVSNTCNLYKPSVCNLVWSVLTVATWGMPWIQPGLKQPAQAYVLWLMFLWTNCLEKHVDSAWTYPCPYPIQGAPFLISRFFLPSNAREICLEAVANRMSETGVNILQKLTFLFPKSAGGSTKGDIAKALSLSSVSDEPFLKSTS